LETWDSRAKMNGCTDAHRKQEKAEKSTGSLSSFPVLFLFSVPKYCSAAS